uniref:hypothetical protein n=1 Tax=Ningiella ruwaisensis TaxID=2364274 RepID=UPI0010A0C0E4|nr:hypothetical protein [Ningiella ruwaisensis]
MCMFLKDEQQHLEKMLMRRQTMENLQKSKIFRLKKRIRTLLVSKRGLCTMFLLGAFRELNSDKDGASDKSKLRKHSSTLARLGLSAWLS